MVLQLATEQRRARRLDVRTISPIELDFMSKLDGLMVGQPAAKDAARWIFRRMHSKIRNFNQPIGVLLLVGPSRTGKTLLARSLAQIVHGNPDCLIKINGGEYMEKEHLATLLGAHNQLVGYTKPEEMGASSENQKDAYAEFAPHNLFKWARRGSKAPFTFILVDEWEKACWEFNNLLLSIFDDGTCNLGNGTLVNFRNCVFILASNLGMEEVEKLGSRIGFTQHTVTHGDIESTVMKHLKLRTPPEFRNRLKENGRTVIYDPLTAAQMVEVCDMEINKLQTRLGSNPETAIQLAVEPAVRALMLQMALADNGNISNLKDVMERELLDPVNNEMLKGQVQPGDRVDVLLDGDQIVFECTRGALLLGSAAVDAAVEQAVGQNAGVVATSTQRRAISRRSIGNLPFTLYEGGLYDAFALPMPEMIFFETAVRLQMEARMNPDFMGEYVLNLRGFESLEGLTLKLMEVMQDLQKFMGIEILNSSTAYTKPFSASLKIRAIPGQLQLIRIRFPELGIARDTTGDTMTA
jgi:hypothetical protein